MMYRLCFVLLLLGTAWQLTAVAQDQRQTVSRLLARLPHASTPVMKVDILNEIAYVYESRGAYRNRDSAIVYSRQALALSKKTGYSKGYWRALDICYDSYAIYGNYTESFRLIENFVDTHVVQMLFSSGVVFKNSIWRTPDIDSALIFYRKALAISEKVGSTKWIQASHRHIFRCYMEAGDTLTALREIRLFAGKNKPADVARVWTSMGRTLSETTSLHSFKLTCHQNAIRLYRQLNDQKQVGENLLWMADSYLLAGNTSLAEQYYLQAFPLLKQTGSAEVMQAALKLHDYYFQQGDLEKALYYSFEVKKGGEKYPDDRLDHVFLYQGDAGVLPGRLDNNTEGDLYVTHLKQEAKRMVIGGKAREALQMILQEYNRLNVTDDYCQMEYAEALGNCYAALGDYAEAEKCYARMMRYSRLLTAPFSASAPFTIGKFYYDTRQYGKAAPYLEEYLQSPRMFTAITGIGQAHLMLSHIDSSRAAYASALRHLQLHKQINDSIFSALRTRQVAELQVLHDMDKKDQDLRLQHKDIELLMQEKQLQQSLTDQKTKDLQLKQQHIDLLRHEADLAQAIASRQLQDLQQKEKELKLQQENIGLLESRDQLQRKQLRQANFLKTMTIGGIVLLLIIVGLLYNQYRIKQRNNQAISSRNDQLNGLLQEKEWLLKEVHHRVKNNLQVVVSLLQSQSVYLQDEALDAVHNSQHRVQAMALIHQKLYQADNVTTIQMNTYIPELVQYLQDSFVSRTRIRFDIEVAPVAMDVTLAIPLGLIINEAVTNVFKHAFTGRDRGQVAISLQPLHDQQWELRISDNGIGMAANEAAVRPASLGMSLMQGLCRDFNGTCTIDSYHGTHIRVVFARPVFQPAERGSVGV
ncbi:histidine kinase dimerization/phosphoacceptor domain -containing protein [Paraflavitalea pollutisoli]|uniref:histidine kinase dimerization/phosphoacceptor domain -containing protein n=1 Tax=Paraflavitalea pollutisoli TaxID=3034143 RepID=UPI0023ECDFD5|nr:histidine kinase dimerization/phosphoacceptor domain -containing protein [Paraflavitalea sp. H1-2-19X]